MKTTKWTIYRDRGGKWRWRFKAANGRIIAVSSEGYENRADCHHALNLVLNEQLALAKVEIIR